jgi:ribonuclease HII
MKHSKPNSVKKPLKLPWDERLNYERNCWERGCRRIAGLDEAGRGPLAGPVVAAAFILQPELKYEILNDSKLLSVTQREVCYRFLTSGAWEFAVGVVDSAEIDRVNIYQASRLAMLRALEFIQPAPDHLLVDALVVPGTTIPQTAIIHGDALSVAIAAASVIAKFTRDQLMNQYEVIYPGYGFAKHKGYPTYQHYQALTQLGPSPIHRRSFCLTRQVSDKSLELFTKVEVYKF